MDELYYNCVTHLFIHSYSNYKGRKGIKNTLHKWFYFFSNLFTSLAS